MSDETEKLHVLLKKMQCKRGWRIPSIGTIKNDRYDFREGLA